MKNIFQKIQASKSLSLEGKEYFKQLAKKSDEDANKISIILSEEEKIWEKGEVKNKREIEEFFHIFFQKTLRHILKDVEQISKKNDDTESLLVTL